MSERPEQGTLSRKTRNRALLVLSMACVAVVAMPPVGTRASLAPDDWANFHHDALHSGVSADTIIGAQVAPTLTTKWSQPVHLPGGGHRPVRASPVVVYNTALGKTLVYDVNGKGVAEAFDAANGTPIWTQNVAASVQDTPAVDANTLYFGDQRGRLFGLDATTGKIQCIFQLPIVAPETAPGRILTAPVVGHADGTGPVVYFGDAGQTETLNAGHEWAMNGVGNINGGCTEKWAFNGFADKGVTGNKTGSWSSPALAQNSTGEWVVVFGSSSPDDSVYAVDAVTGAEVWHFPTTIGHDDDVGAAPTISAPGVNGFADGVVYVDGKDKIEYTIDLTTGTAGAWRFNLGLDSGLNTNSVSCAALTENLLVVAYSGYVYAFNATTGVKVWRTATATGTIFASVSVSGAPGDRLVMVGDLLGGEYGYRLTDGSLIFSMNVGSAIVASTAVSDGMAFFASGGGFLYALGAPA